jgi:hypothetical protein
MAFTGKAVYDSGVFPETAEDVSPVVSVISPFETPWLDLIGDSNQSATNVIHEYMEGRLAPSRLYNTAHIGTSGTTMTVTPAVTAKQVMKGTVVENENSGEHFVVTAIEPSGAGTLTIARGFGGTVPDTIAIAHTLTILFNSMLEGADVDQDISVSRTRKTNIVQPFKKDIIISGTFQAISKVGGVSDELNWQVVSRTREILRDLERASIRGLLSTSTLGSSTEYRTMLGLWNGITTNVNTYSAGNLSSTVINGYIKQAWENGARDLDTIICGKNAKDEIDRLLEAQRRVVQGQGPTRNFEMVVDVFDSSYGTLRIMLNRWMKPSALVVTSSRRFKVLPLQGRSFQFEPIAKTGDSTKGMIVGEYTAEIYNQEGMSKAY